MPACRVLAGRVDEELSGPELMCPAELVFCGVEARRLRDGPLEQRNRLLGFAIRHQLRRPQRGIVPAGRRLRVGASSDSARIDNIISVISW